jgi:RNA polymerase sigma-70 factor (ECF subfamily)
MSHSAHDTDSLICQVSQGDEAAVEQLFSRHRTRLKRVVTWRMDRRIATRVDPSDVVQDVLVEAARKLDDYVARRPIPFFPWLRQIAWERLVKLREHHVKAQKRSASREEDRQRTLSEESADALAERLFAREASPSAYAVHNEMRRRVRAALDMLPENDRDVLAMRYLEQLSASEIAAVLGLTDAAVKARHYRALRRLRNRMAGGSE